MNTFDPKAEADALLASLAAAGNGEEMAVSVGAQSGVGGCQGDTNRANIQSGQGTYSAPLQGR